MDDPDPAGENRTFKINFGSEGVSMLRQRVKEKLKEYMGDYTDDTLVEYVLVLLRNGRSKDEAWRELNVFLGEDSVAFVSWLWDHLSSNLHLYTQPKESSPDEMFKMNRMLDDQPGRQNSQLESVRGEVETDSDTERGSLSRTSRVRRKREWKGLVQEEFPLRSTVAKILRSDNDNHGSNARHSPPMREVGKKRIREDDQHQTKRDAPSHPVIGATRRLLQFAVRDAVRTVQQASSRTEPASKRLRSVVSTSTAESLRERPQKLRSVARVPGALSTALKAAAEAAEDVTKDRYSGSVFDRLSHGAHAANREHIKDSSVYAEHMLEDGEYENADQITTSKHAEFYQRSYDGNFTGDMTMLERESEMAADSASDNDEYNNLGVVRQRSSVSQCASSANKDKKSLTLQYSVAQDADEVVRNTRLIDEEPTTGAAAKASSKIVNISVNVNTWKPPHYEMPRDLNNVESRKAVDKSEVNEVAANPKLPEQNNTTKALNDIARADVPKEPQKALMSTPGSYTISRPSVDVDSRTLFVSNVHFAATKDTLSRHFNKFGEVLKVIIVNDAATGQPKGSAYVEFLRKESAESALSLNGTSFMSRILKVVQKSSMHHEAAAMMGWPRVARASPFASRLSRVPFPRGVIPGAFRARLPLKPGARSLQWKRGGSALQTTAEAAKSSQPVTNVPSPTGRNLTYIRPESKVEPNPGQA